MLLRSWVIRVASVFLMFGVLVSSAPPAHAQSCGSFVNSDFFFTFPNPYSQSSGSPLQARVRAIALDTTITPLPVTISAQFTDTLGRRVSTSTPRTINSSFDLQSVPITPVNRLSSGLYFVQLTFNAGVCGTRSSGSFRAIIN